MNETNHDLSTETNEEPKAEKKPAGKRWRRLAIGVGLGALLGFGFYYFIGCSSGGCPITSNPMISTGYGAVFGALFSWS